MLAVGLAAVSTHPLRGQSPQNDGCSSGEAQSRIAACTRILERAGLDIESRVAAHVNRGNVQDAIGQFDLALKDYQSALAVQPDSWFALRSRAAAYYRHNQLADSLRDLSHAVQALPDDPSPLRLRAQLYIEMGQTARAVEDFSKVLDRSPGDLSTRQARGLALAATGDHARAILDFNRVLERDPRMRVARAARAYSLFQTRQYRLAILDWDQLLRDDPSQMQILYCRGAAKVLIGDESGRADMDSVRQQKPEVAAAESTACPAT